ncbi:hypothetical protein JOC36_000001 [Weissella uvarum]|uniref:hypothetical protein n=1 Tax=Weissella uvarum TaxID=1479233 RepID=UPI00196187D9|nr:hypothetical protein [Weissella uvarum]MBM7616468.1 hypothetical protein [Weissella uvarum]MCM0595071.1 hypothetical protein [Weissella uvarum]
MTLIAGTIIFTRDDQSFFMVKDGLPISEFYTVRMHQHEDDTALGALLAGMKDQLGLNLDNLRLGELAVWHREGRDDSIDSTSLFTFEVIDDALLNFDRLEAVGMEFVNARDAVSLVKNVDMSGVIGLD